jgi:hypothetical protein
MTPDVWIVRCRFTDNYSPPPLIFDDVLTLTGPHAGSLAGSRFASEGRRMEHRDRYGMSHADDIVTLEHNGVTVKTARPGEPA